MFNINTSFTNFNLKIIEYENKKYLDFKFFLLVIGNYSSNCNVHRELSYISKYNYVKKRDADDKRKRKILVNGDGVVEFLQKTLRLTMTDKNNILAELKKHNMINNNILLSLTRKENNFKDDLLLFFKPFNIAVESQVTIDTYIVDFLIDSKLVIEYDEIFHDNYDKKQEELREKYIINNGYKIIRIKDNMSNIEAISIIFNKYLKYKGVYL